MSLAELAHPLAPLAGTVVVAHLLARGDQVAARPGDARQDLRFSAQGGRHRLVEAPHPRLQVTLADQRQSLQPQADHLQLGNAEAAPDLHRLRGQPPGIAGSSSTTIEASCTASHP